jgi:histo-blood group ABO system transferase
MAKFYCFILMFFSMGHLLGANVGLLIVATGNYDRFVDPLIDSAEKYFLPGHNVTYYVFSEGRILKRDNVVVIPQARLGWPFDTLKRYHVYYQNQESFAGEDYLFAMDADMLFHSVVGDEILGELVATIHPGYYRGNRGTYDTNPNSLACVYPYEGKHYFAGGFYGGTKDAFLKAIKTNIDRIDEDYAKGIIALWHDESHWNRYCIDNPPTVILSPAYCHPVRWHLPFEVKIEPLDKNHAELRKN